jgi:ubiquinone/menaquinone biosynthesis C-methylase UbiE
LTTIPDHLHLGCGNTTPDGWLNVDGSWGARLHNHPMLLKVALALTGKKDGFAGARNIYGHNLVKPLPWPDNTFRAVYASHTLEHMYRDDVDRLLRECLRVLKPGGVARFVVPDLAPLIAGYTSGQFPAWLADHPPQTTNADSFVLGLLMRSAHRPRGNPINRLYEALNDFHSHKWMYNAESLAATLKRAGFVDITNPGFAHSRISNIAGIEQSSRVEHGAGVVAEGVKPG